MVKAQYPEAVRKACQEIITQPPDREYSPQNRGLLIGWLERLTMDVCITTGDGVPFYDRKKAKHCRRLVTAFLLLPDSSKFVPVHGNELQDNHFHALRRWMGDESTLRRSLAMKEAHWILPLAEWCVQQDGLLVHECMSRIARAARQNPAERTDIEPGDRIDHTLLALGGNLWATQPNEL